MRNHREAIELALAGGAPEIIPLTFYDALYPPGFDPTPLYAQGLAICARRCPFTRRSPNVKTTSIREADGSTRYYHETPVGTVTSRWKPAALGNAPLEHPIKTRDDYRIARFIVEDTRYLPAYEAFQEAIEKIGTAGKVIGDSAYEPLLDIQVMWVGQEQFCYELADNEDALLELHAALAKQHLQMYEVAAASPADHVLYGGNVVPEMLGPERVRELVAPCWNAFAERLHAQGKKIGCHLDANNLTILDTVRDSALDFIEAFTPPPDCNVSVAEARAAWPGKRLWINFPSSVHIQSDEDIREATLEIVRQVGDRKGFLIGVTEDIPEQHIARSVGAILETLAGCRL